MLKYLGVSSAGLAFASAAEIAREKIKSVPGDTKEELKNIKLEVEELRSNYDKLDKKTKIILRVFLVTSGLDIFLTI